MTDELRAKLERLGSIATTFNEASKIATEGIMATGAYLAKLGL